MTTKMIKHQQLSLIVVMLKTKVRLAKRPAIILFWEIWIIVNLLGKLFWSKILVTDCQSRRCNLLLSNWQFYLPRLSCEEIWVLQQECFQKVSAPIGDWTFSQSYLKSSHWDQKGSSLQGNISRISRRCLSVISNLVQTFTTIFFPIFLKVAPSKQWARKWYFSFCYWARRFSLRWSSFFN